jgi:hypothetical protein
MSDPGGDAPSSTCPLANCSRALNAGGAIVFRERRGPLAPMRRAHIAGYSDRSVLGGKRILSSSSQQAPRNDRCVASNFELLIAFTGNKPIGRRPQDPRHRPPD